VTATNYSARTAIKAENATAVSVPIERPVLFSGPMVRAILEGRKSQTRRVVKPQPPHGIKSVYAPITRDPGNWQGVASDDLIGWYGRCPYGIPGDRLWVRETFQRARGGFQYRADGITTPRAWKPSIFMPRTASRITLEVTGVRVERLQDISEKDARAEGVDAAPCFCIPYRRLWDSLNAKRGFGWEKNPWVWCISFSKAAP